MKIDSKKLRILFVDDEDLEITKSLTREGYDVEHWRDVESLDRLCDGRYQVVFLDVRGVGVRDGGTGLDVLKYVASHNPLLYVAIFSAKPFTGAEAETIRKYAKRAITKDCTLYDIIDIIEDYASTLSEEKLLQELQDRMPLGFFARWKIKRGYKLSHRQIEKISSSSSFGVDAIKIVANVTTIVVTIIKLMHGAA